MQTLREVSKCEPEKTLYFDTFHAVRKLIAALVYHVAGVLFFIRLTSYFKVFEFPLQ